tara:strand:- start:27 stop:521 length:495 start_codon:yes stop_codon:yes gene_type:complete
MNSLIFVTATLNIIVRSILYMAYSGFYKPKNPKKYRGNPTRIVYRSLWERKYMMYCDNTPSILEWGSEEIAIPYRSPIDNRSHRYYPDFYIKVREKGGKISKYIVEIKPKKQTKPPYGQDKRTKAYKNAVLTFVKNRAKWDAAEDYCDDRQMKFLILTEDHLAV